ncbi:RNA-binding protein YhbY [Clostridiales bacterium]|nr:RNA-binding protein YhbY [Clostridiales bacterium]
MLTSKQRAFLRGMANGIESIIHVGKSGITPEMTEAVDKALEARELIKANLLNNCDLDTRETAQTIAERTHSDVVQVIGKRFVLYRAAKEPVIELPKAKRGQ